MFNMQHMICYLNIWHFIFDIQYICYSIFSMKYRRMQYINIHVYLLGEFLHQQRSTLTHLGQNEAVRSIFLLGFFATGTGVATQQILFPFCKAWTFSGVWMFSTKICQFHKRPKKFFPQQRYEGSLHIIASGGRDGAVLRVSEVGEGFGDSGRFRCTETVPGKMEVWSLTAVAEGKEVYTPAN